MPTVAQQIVAAGTAEIGVHEIPPRSNRGPRVEFFQSLDWLAGGGYAWCVDFAWGFATWHAVLTPLVGKPNPYPTASVAQLEAWARQHGWVAHGPKPGDLCCLGGHHVTIYHHALPGGSPNFAGLGGNQSDQVKISEYAVSSITTLVRPPASLTVLPEPGKKPRFEVVTGDGEKARVVFTSPSMDKALGRAGKILAGPARVVTIRERRR